ncbi:trehalase family glycosidase [Termitidicoccus mucosus]|uniref:Mannosylglycerate hydrolase MGH1-like glycoside hydrolase domain-containing protein n=1 Tax=Termitidicoccus mucosus TaxID=1184151 RepID=A0A178ICL0_9BACT|nr:hypothetical protein AW736_20580 [Opitutaceae bacterium TSB47]
MNHPYINYEKELFPSAGWNTWSTRSALAHVLMPAALAVELSFCHYGMLHVISSASFGIRQRGATAGVRLSGVDIKTQPEGLEPGRHAYDGSYTSLTVVMGETRIRVESARVGDDGLVILVTPVGKFPLRPVSMIAEGSFLWNRPGCIVQTGPDCWRAHGMARGDVHIYCTGKRIRDPNAGHRSPYWVLELSGPAGIAAGGAPRTLDEIGRIIAKARAAEDAAHRRYGRLAELHAAYQACLAWNTFYEPAHERVITTSSRPWNVLRLGYGLFCWDTFTFAWMQAPDAPELARNSIREVFREMVDGEFIPNVANGSGRRSWDRSQPPLAGLTMLAIHEMAPDRGFLAAIFPALLAWNRWWDRARRNPRGLLSWGSHPFPPRIGDLAERLQPNTGRGAALESGMDNSPMYDDAPFDTRTHLMALSDVGLASLYITDCQALALLASELGLAAEASETTERAAFYTKNIAALWNPDAGVYQNRRTDTGEFSPRLSPTVFYPMLAGVATGEQSRSMVDNFLLHPEKFWGDWVLPSVPRDDPAFPEQLYWRGRVWPVLNFLVYLGLKRAGHNAAAAMLAERSRILFEQNWREHSGAFENYSAITGRATEEKFCDPMYAWSGLLVFMQLMEQKKVPIPSLLVADKPAAAPDRAPQR